jgi:tetratricopeptide (TPR) repeat protein
VNRIASKTAACAVIASALMVCANGRVRGATLLDFYPCEALDPTVVYHDLRDPTNAILLGTVERNHFTPDVEQLRKGFTAPLPRDIAFVLRQFPNHYRALYAMATWQLRNKGPLDAENNIWSADCYFQRAIAFRPEDWKVHFIYGIYLHKAHRLPEAEAAYDAAEAAGATGADYYYNRGLLEVDLGHLDRAEEYARSAYAAGHPLPGLREKLAHARAQTAHSIANQ